MPPPRRIAAPGADGEAPARAASGRSRAARPPGHARARFSVRLEEVSKVYPNGKVALIDVDLVIPEGDFVFLVGPSAPARAR